jgi:hypothetical protein
MKNSSILKLLNNLHPTIVGSEVKFNYDENDDVIIVEFLTMPDMPIITEQILNGIVDDIFVKTRKYLPIFNEIPDYKITGVVSDELKKDKIIINDGVKRRVDDFKKNYHEPFKFDVPTENSLSFFPNRTEVLIYPNFTNVRFDNYYDELLVYLDFDVEKIVVGNVKLTDEIINDFIISYDEEPVTKDYILNCLYSYFDNYLADNQNFDLIGTLYEYFIQPFNPYKIDYDLNTMVTINTEEIYRFYSDVFLVKSFVSFIKGL